MNYVPKMDGSGFQRGLARYLKSFVPGYSDRKRRQASERRNKSLLFEISDLYTRRCSLEKELSISESRRGEAEAKNTFYETALDKLAKDIESQKGLNAHLKEQVGVERRRNLEFLTASYPHLALVVDNSGYISFANASAKEAQFNRGKQAKDYGIDLSNPRQDFFPGGTHYVCRVEELSPSDGYLVLFRKKGWLRRRPGVSDKIIKRMIERAKKTAEEAQKALDEKARRAKS